MAGSADVIKQFLISIAYKVDPTSERTFVNSVEKSAKVVGGFVGVALGAVTALAFAVDKVTEKFEQLYYSSKRSGTSVRDIQNFSYAVSQMGGSADEAAASLESFGTKLREQPGFREMLKRMGVDVSDYSHRSLAIMKDFMKHLAGMSPVLQRTYSEMFGIDYRTLQAGMAGTSGFEAQQNAKLKAMGLDPEAAALASRDMQQVFRGFSNTLGLIWDAVALKFVKAFRDPFVNFDNLVQALAPTIVARFGDLADAAKRFSDWLVAGMQSDEFRQWVVWITSESTWKGWKDQLSEVGKEFATILRVAYKLARVTELLLAAPKGIKDWMSSGFNLEGGNKNWNNLDDTPTGSIGGRGGIGGYEGGTGADASRGVAGANMGLIYKAQVDQLMKEGLSPEAAKYAAAALGGNAQQESGGNPNTIHDKGTGYGIYGARLERKDKMLAWMKEHGYAMNSPEGQGRYMAHEAMSGKYGPTAAALRRANAGNLGEVTNIVSGNFESPNPALANNQGRRNNAARLAQLYASGAAPVRMAMAIPKGALGAGGGARAAALGIGSIGGGGGGTTITVHNENHISVKTDNHPEKIAHAVGKEIGRRNAAALRDMPGAAQ